MRPSGIGLVLGIEHKRAVLGVHDESGEAKQQYEEIIKAARKMADDAVNNEEITPQYREKIKRYFDDLN